MTQIALDFSCATGAIDISKPIAVPRQQPKPKVEADDPVVEFAAASRRQNETHLCVGDQVLGLKYWTNTVGVVESISWPYAVVSYSQYETEYTHPLDQLYLATEDPDIPPEWLCCELSKSAIFAFYEQDENGWNRLDYPTYFEGSQNQLPKFEKICDRTIWDIQELHAAISKRHGTVGLFPAQLPYRIPGPKNKPANGCQTRLLACELDGFSSVYRLFDGGWRYTGTAGTTEACIAKIKTLPGDCALFPAGQSVQTISTQPPQRRS